MLEILKKIDNFISNNQIIKSFKETSPNDNQIEKKINKNGISCKIKDLKIDVYKNKDNSQIVDFLNEIKENHLENIKKIKNRRHL